GGVRLDPADRERHAAPTRCPDAPASDTDTGRGAAGRRPLRTRLVTGQDRQEIWLRRPDDPSPPHRSCRDAGPVGASGAVVVRPRMAADAPRYGACMSSAHQVTVVARDDGWVWICSCGT